MYDTLLSPRFDATRAAEASVAIERSAAAFHHLILAAGNETARAIADSPTLRTVTAGGLAGAVSRTCTAPVDRLKVLVQEGHLHQQQKQQLHCPHLKQAAVAGQGDIARALAIARHVYHHDGVLAFWRGNGVNCLKAGPEQAMAFAAREFYLQRICSNALTPTVYENFCVGALAGFTAQLVLYPLEVVKTRVAVAAVGEYQGIADCVRQSLRRGGIRDLYRGCAANTLGILPHRGLDMGTFFTLESAVKRRFRVASGNLDPHEPMPLPVWATLGCGVVASVISQTVTYPLNLIRTKLQTQGVNGRPMRYRGIADCFATVLREDGPRGLFAGIWPNMAKAVPSTALSYVVFRKCTEALDRDKAR